MIDTQTITTREELDALPIGTVVNDSDGDNWRRDANGEWGLRVYGTVPQEFNEADSVETEELAEYYLPARIVSLPNQITVEDIEGLMALPIGTKLLDDDGDLLVMRKRPNGDLGVVANIYGDDEEAGPYGIGYAALPAVVLNPEILGEFVTSEPIEEELAEWEKELLRPSLAVGDIVRIGAGESEMTKWHGLRGEVVELGSPFSLIHADKTYIHPLGERPWGRGGFWWPTDDLHKVEEETASPFAVGDRVIVTYRPDSQWNGVGTVTLVGDWVNVRLDHRDDEGGFELDDVELLVEEAEIVPEIVVGGKVVLTTDLLDSGEVFVKGEVYTVTETDEGVTYPFRIGTEDGDSLPVRRDEIEPVIVEVIEPVERKGFVVGDEVSGSEVAALPDGTIIENVDACDTSVLVKIDGDWYNPFAPREGTYNFYATNWSEFTIIRLPKDA